jgi:copper chaperone CopZ
MQQVALDQGIIQTGDTLTDQEKIMARLAIIQKDSSDAQGDAIRTADSYSNVMKALTAEFQEFGIEVGQQLMPVIKQFAKVMIFILENAFDPKFVRSLIFAMTALSISMLTTEKRMKSMGKTIKGLKASFAALSKSVGKFLKIMIAFEVAGYIFDKIFPGEEELKETSKGIEDITLELKAYNDELSRMTIEQIQVELDEKTLIKTKQEAALHQEELNERFSVNLDYPQVTTPIAPGFDATFIKLGTTEFQRLQEEISMLKIRLAELTGSNLDFSKSQLKVIKETEKLNKQLFVYGEEIGTSVADQRKANEAMARYGININDKVLPAQQKLIDELEEYIKLEGELTAQNEISKIETKIAKLNGQSAAQIFLNEQRAKGISISKEDAQIITDLHDRYEDREEEVKNAAQGQQIFNEIMQESQNQEVLAIDTKLFYLDALAKEIGLTNELAIEMDNLLNKKQEIEDLDGKTHKLSMFRNEAQRDGILLLMNNMSALAAQHKQGAKVAARLSQIEAFINTYEGVTEALSDKDYIGAAAILAGGLAAVAQIENAMGQIGSYADGGYVGGSPHSQGGTIIEAERGEFVMSRAAVDSIGLETLNQMNQGGGSGTGTVIINVTGNVMEQDYVEGELAELIKEAIRRGTDFGIDDHFHFFGKGVR